LPPDNLDWDAIKDFPEQPFTLPWRPPVPGNPIPAEPGAMTADRLAEHDPPPTEADRAHHPDYRNYLYHVNHEFQYLNPQQNHWKLDVLKEAAKETFPQLQEVAGGIAQQVGATVEGNLKSDTRINEKIRWDYLGSPAPIMDLARSSIQCDSFQKIGDALDLVRERAAQGEFEIVKEKNRFEKPADSGYCDYLLNLRMPNGHIVELQLQHERIQQHKDWEHRITYEPVQEIQRAAKSDGRDTLNPDERQRVDALYAQTKPVYEREYEEAKRREPGFHGFKLR
jgi:ppGpp synthetase/RelA/SpoT-type nucleotidyltranferase